MFDDNIICQTSTKGNSNDVEFIFVQVGDLVFKYNKLFSF